MKSALLFLAAFTGFVLADDDIIPGSYTKDRYQGLAAKSPFDVATPVEAPVEAKPDPFANIALKGMGTDYVILQRLGDDHSIRLIGNEPVEGFTIKKINYSDIPGKATVEIVKDGQEGKVGYNQNDVRSAAPQPVTRPIVPGTPGGRPPTFQPPKSPVPSPNISTTPRPPGNFNTPSTIPRPTGLPQPSVQSRPTFGTPGATSATGSTSGRSSNDSSSGRQRIRDLRINNR